MQLYRLCVTRQTLCNLHSRISKYSRDINKNLTLSNWASEAELHRVGYFVQLEASKIFKNFLEFDYYYTLHVNMKQKRYLKSLFYYTLHDAHNLCECYILFYKFFKLWIIRRNIYQHMLKKFSKRELIFFSRICLTYAGIYSSWLFII